MSTTEGGNFFRGSEFTRLLILGAVIAIGWPLVLYYGFTWPAARAPQKPPTAASLPPLPPADDSKEFGLVLDRTIRTFRDTDALALLTERVRTTPPAVLSAKARRDVLPVSLLQNPKRYRGLPVHLEGFAVSVFALDDQDPTITQSGRLYEIWLRSLDHDQRMYPCCLILEDVPPTLLAGKDLEQRVSFDGYFLKLLAYQSRDGFRPAPMLVGRLTHFPDESAPAPAPRSRLWTFLPLIMLVAYASIRLLFLLRKNRAPSRPTKGFSSPTDQIEPEALNRWLAETDLDEDEDDPEPR